MVTRVQFQERLVYGQSDQGQAGGGAQWRVKVRLSVGQSGHSVWEVQDECLVGLELSV